MSVRDEIAAGCTLPGVTNVTPHYRQTTKPGEGIVHLAGLARSDNGFGYMDTWQVVILLPQDIRSAQLWMDEHLTALVVAAEEVLILTSADPAQVPMSEGTVPALVLEGVRAHE